MQLKYLHLDQYSVVLLLLLFLSQGQNALISQAALSWQSSDGDVFGHYRWRLEIPSTVSANVTRSYRTVLTHLNTSSSTRWLLKDSDSSRCRLESPNSTSTLLSCNEFGNVHVQLSTAEEKHLVDQFEVPVSAHRSCLLWKLVHSSGTSDIRNLFQLPSHSNSESLHIWAYSPDDGSAEELDNTAMSPSASSMVISEHLYRLGENPSVEFPVSSGLKKLAPLTFDENLLVWVLNISTSSSSAFRVHIAGNGVTTMRCQTEEQGFMLTVKKYEPSLTREPSWSNSSVTTTRLVRSDACTPTIRVLPFVGTNAFFFTQDSFKTVDLLRLPVTDESIIDVAPTQFGMAMLTNTSVWYTSDLITMQRALGLPLNAAAFNRMQATEACDPLLDENHNTSPGNRFVAVWHSNNSTSFYYSFEGGKQFEPIAIPTTTLFGTSTRLFSIIYLQSHHTLIGLFGDANDNSQHRLARFHLQSSTWAEGFLFAGRNRLLAPAAHANTRIPRLQHAMSGSDELFIVGYGLWASSDGGRSAQSVHLWSRSSPSPSPKLASDEYVAQLALARGTSAWAALTSRNRLFFGSMPLPDSIELQSGERRSDDDSSRSPPFLLLHNDGSDRLPLLHMVTPSANSSKRRRRRIDVSGEVLSQRFPLADNPRLQCPFLGRGLVLSEVNYIDMGEEVVVHREQTLPYPAPVGLRARALSLAVSEQDVLTFTTTTNWTAFTSPPRTQLHHTATIRELPRPYESRVERLQNAVSNAAFRLFDTFANLACPALEVIGRVRVGCPPGRHIRVRKPALPSCSYAEGQAYEVNGKQYRFERALYGCPISVFHQTDGFRPIVDIYEYERRVREVHTDYVVWEENSRSDFTYNATVADARCLSNPLSWSEVLNNEPNRIANKAWTPNNHRSCFESPTAPSQTLPSNDHKYEIMNSSGVSYLIFPSDGKDGLFLFNLRVVDPDYSYCDLSTQFALDVYGAPLDTLTSLISVLSMASFLIIVLSGSFFWYRRSIGTWSQEQD